MTPPCAAEPDLWFSTVPADRELAARICGTCLRKLSCAAGAIERGEEWGCWGGESMEPRAAARLTEQMAAGVLEAAVHVPSRACYTAGCRAAECTRLNAAYVASWRDRPVTTGGIVDVQMELFEGAAG